MYATDPPGWMRAGGTAAARRAEAGSSLIDAGLTIK